MIASARKTPRQVALAGCNRQLSASLRRPNRPQESRAFRSMPSTNTTLRLRAAGGLMTAKKTLVHTCLSTLYISSATELTEPEPPEVPLLAVATA